MKTLTTLLIAFAALTLNAQSNEFRIMVSKNQPLSTSWNVYGITVHFCSNGSNYTDGLDQLSGSVTDSSMIMTYTEDSASDILAFDARPTLRQTLNVPFGAWVRDAADMFVQGVWDVPGSEQLYDVFITDNINGGTYNLYQENMFPVQPNMNFSTQYTVTFIPKGMFIGFDESCFGQANGSIYARSANNNWTADLYLNSSFLRNIAISGTDTLITNLAAGTYDIVYMLNGIPTDTESVIVGGPAQIIASATISNNAPLVNDSVFFTNTSTGSMDYAWDFGDGFTSTDVSPNHVYASAGTFVVTLTAYNAAGCDNTIMYTITVSSGMLANHSSLLSQSNPQYINNARTANPDVTSQEGQAHVSMRSEVVIASVSIYAMSGQMVYASSESSTNFDFTYTTPGIYVAHFVYADGSEYTMQVPLN